MVELPKISGSEYSQQRDHHRKLESLYITKSNISMTNNSNGRTTINVTDAIESHQNYVSKRLQKIRKEAEYENLSDYKKQPYNDHSLKEESINDSNLSGNILWT